MKTMTPRAMITALAMFLPFFAFGAAVPYTGEGSGLASTMSLTATAVEFDRRQISPPGDLGACVDLCHDINFANCLQHVCYPARQCVTLTGDWSNGLSSIHFGGGSTTCVLYADDHCSTGDLIVLGAAEPNLGQPNLNFNDRTRSYECARKDKRAIRSEEGSAIAVRTIEVSNTALEPRGFTPPGNLGVCVDLCEDINFTNCPLQGYCSGAGECVHLTGDWTTNGLSSINFGGDATTCVLYALFDCTGDNWVAIFHASPNLSEFDFNDKANSYMCARTSRQATRGVNVPTLSAPLSHSASVSVSTTALARRQDAITIIGTLGTCIDLCQEINYTNCVQHVCSDARGCITLIGDWSNGLSSVNFGGDKTTCVLFANLQCRKGDFVYTTKPQPNLGTFGWDNKAKSIACARKE